MYLILLYTLLDKLLLRPILYVSLDLVNYWFVNKIMSTEFCLISIIQNVDF